jgi:hypothetical protein
MKRITVAEEAQYHAVLARASGNTLPLSVEEMAVGVFYALTAPDKRGKRTRDEEALLRAALPLTTKWLDAFLKQRRAM